MWGVTVCIVCWESKGICDQISPQQAAQSKMRNHEAPRKIVPPKEKSSLIDMRNLKAFRADDNMCQHCPSLLPPQVFLLFNQVTDKKAWMTNWSLVLAVVQLLNCVWLCDPMDCSTPGFPVHHRLPEFAHTHVHQVGDAVRPSRPLSSPSPPALNLSQHQGLF